MVAVYTPTMNMNTRSCDKGTSALDRVCVWGGAGEPMLCYGECAVSNQCTERLER